MWPEVNPIEGATFSLNVQPLHRSLILYIYIYYKLHDFYILYEIFTNILISYFIKNYIYNSNKINNVLIITCFGEFGVRYSLIESGQGLRSPWTLFKSNPFYILRDEDHKYYMISFIYNQSKPSHTFILLNWQNRGVHKFESSNPQILETRDLQAVISSCVDNQMGPKGWGVNDRKILT